MVKRRSLCLLLVLVMMASCIGTAYAATPGSASPQAFNSFQMNLLAGELGKAESSFSLAAGETVTINAVYTPADASVEFGLISPDGLFHPLPGSDGAFKATIEVPTRGQYTLAVRNNSHGEVSVAGVVNY